MMETTRIGRLPVLITFAVMMNTAPVWGQSKGTSIANEPLREVMIADSKNKSTGCSTVARSEYRDWAAINALRPSANGVMVAEDMRCRQCRGKCSTENLRCRSQCSGDGVCLAQCEERLSTCETMCKQIFQCELPP
jgi:hypothetical protein